MTSFLFAALLVAQTSTSAPTSLEVRYPEERIAALQQGFDEATPAAQRWYFGFMGALGGLTVVQAMGLIIAPEIGLPQDLRNTLTVGAINSLVGFVGHTVIGFGPAFSAARYRAAALTAEQKLALGEQIAREDAAAVRMGRGWFGHVVAVVLGVGSGLALWLGYNQVRDGIIMCAVTIAVSELRIWTTPTHALKNEVSVNVVGVPNGLGLQVAY